MPTEISSSFASYIVGTMDFDVTHFSMQTDQLTPGMEVPFSLDITVRLNGSASIGPIQYRDDLAVEYQFFLSKHNRVDHRSIDLGFDMLDHIDDFDQYYVLNKVFELDSATENIVS